MVPFKQLFTSTLGRKYLMGASGFALVGFVIMHLLGNLTLYAKNGDLVNAYSAKLHSLGVALLVLEIGLIAMVIIHIITALQVTYSAKAARPIGYKGLKTKGGPTRNNVSSRNMIITGVVLLLFLGIHLYQFKYGPNIAEGYTTTVDGVMVHDIYRVVAETFSKIQWVVFYAGSMLFLGFHLRHGFWSAFQSLGIINPRFSKPIYATGIALAVILTLGFLFIPIYMYYIQAGVSGGAL